jgi:3' exoribonuclease family, domain 2
VPQTDCANLAVVAALMHFRRPDVTVVGETITIHGIEDRQPVPLSLHHIPICVTFAFFEDGNQCIIDPTGREELAMTGSLTITINIHKEICAVQKAGGVTVHTSLILKCASLAFRKAVDLTDALRDVIEKDIEHAEKNRNMKTKNPIELFGRVRTRKGIDIKGMKINKQAQDDSKDENSSSSDSNEEDSDSDSPSNTHHATSADRTMPAAAQLMQVDDESIGNNDEGSSNSDSGSDSDDDNAHVVSPSSHAARRAEFQDVVAQLKASASDTSAPAVSDISSQATDDLPDDLSAALKSSTSKHTKRKRKKIKGKKRIR